MIEKLVNRDLASNADILVWNEVVPDKNWWFISQYIFFHPSHDRFSEFLIRVLHYLVNWKKASLHKLRFSVAVLELNRTILRKNLIRIFGNFIYKLCFVRRQPLVLDQYIECQETSPPTRASSLATRNVLPRPVDLRYWKLDQIREKKNLGRQPELSWPAERQ